MPLPPKNIIRCKSHGIVPWSGTMICADIRGGCGAVYWGGGDDEDPSVIDSKTSMTVVCTTCEKHLWTSDEDRVVTNGTALPLCSLCYLLAKAKQTAAKESSN